MKTRTTISVDKDVLSKLKNYGVNISGFCEDEMIKLLELLENSSIDLASQIAQIEEEKRKLDLNLYRLYKNECLKLEYHKESQKLDNAIWVKFVKEFEDFYYGFIDIDLKPVIKATGLEEPQLRALGEFIYSYEDEDELKLNTDLDYALMRYNEENKSSPIRRNV